MPVRSDPVRAAGNVFLIPIPLGLDHLPGARAWQRVLLVGSHDPASRSRAEAALRQVNPGLVIEAVGELGGPSGLRQIRRRGYDVACLLLTGEGNRRDKLLGLLSGASLVLARGRDGHWHQVRLPACRPLRLRWWARLVLCGLLSWLYLGVMLKVRVTDLLWRLGPAPLPVPDPGPPEGRRTTFIVPCHNQRALMDFCLPPLLAEAGQRHRVMVVDDASADGTADYVRQRYPRVSVLRLARNRGFAGAARAGIASSDTPLFALINADVQVRPGFLAAILPHFEREDTFAVCSRIELPGGSHMETGDVAPTFSGILEPHHLPPGPSGPILYAGGASSVFHRARYEALGGLETIFRPLYWEDIELGYRAWRRGWRSVFEPAASVWHQRRAWIGQRFGDAYANETFLKNALIFVWKNVRDRGLLAEHLAYVWARLASELPRGEGAMCRALLRALPLLPPALVKRWREHHRGDLSDGDILLTATPANAQEAPAA